MTNPSPVWQVGEWYEWSIHAMPSMIRCLSEDGQRICESGKTVWGPLGLSKWFTHLPNYRPDPAPGQIWTSRRGGMYIRSQIEAAPWFCLTDRVYAPQNHTGGVYATAMSDMRYLGHYESPQALGRHLLHAHTDNQGGTT